MTIKQMEIEQVRTDIEFIQLLSAHVTDLMCDPNVFKVFRIGYYPEEEMKQVEYLLKNTSEFVYSIAKDKENNGEKFAQERILRTFPKNVREGKELPELDTEKKEAKKQIIEYYNLIREKIEEARENGRISF